MERFRLNYPTPDDVQWLAAVLEREGAPLGTTVTPVEGRLDLRW
jgi:hypothetical protein